MTKKLVKTLLIAMCMIAFGATNAQAAQSPKDVQKAIVTTATKMGVDPFVVLSIAKLESNFNHQKKNPSGAVGVFQLMPDTARRLGVNPYLQNENIVGGVKYYKMMYSKYGSMDLALAAYNAGPGNVKRYGGVPPFRETKSFISNIKKVYSTLKEDPDMKQVVSETL